MGCGKEFGAVEIDSFEFDIAILCKKSGLLGGNERAHLFLPSFQPRKSFAHRGWIGEGRKAEIALSCMSESASG